MPILPLWMPSPPTMQRLLLARLWSMDDQPEAYVVVEAGTQPDPADAPKPTPTLEERLATVESAQTQMAQLPETLAALQKENEMLKQCLLEMSETVYA